MGYFDLPTRELELLLKKKGRGNKKAEWRSVMFADRLSAGEIASCVEDWSINYKVVGARYNGREVSVPNNYHWEHRHKDSVYGIYGTRKEVLDAMQKRKEFNWSEKDKTKKIPIGTPVFVAE